MLTQGKGHANLITLQILGKWSQAELQKITAVAADNWP